MEHKVMNDHKRFIKKLPDGVEAGTALKNIRAKSQLRGSIKPLEPTAEKTKNRSRMLKKTPSVYDSDIKALISKYPCKNKEPVLESNFDKYRSKSIIDTITQQLEEKDTMRYCNYVDMGMMYERH